MPDALADEAHGPDGQSTWDVRVGHAHAPGAAWTHPHPKLAGHVTFSWRQLEWYEEDEPVFVHALDPYKRVDARRSSRRVEIRVGGETVAREHPPAARVRDEPADALLPAVRGRARRAASNRATR